ncbi:MAG: ArsR/SmtB family transcription factor [Roseovarius sp.]
MDKSTTLAGLQALSQETRLDVFRLLMRAGPEGMAAGEIAQTCGVRQNTMSTHLSILSQAGLVRAAREGRSVRYSADIDGIRDLLAFLVHDCCGGNPQQCQTLIKAISIPC